MATQTPQPVGLADSDFARDTRQDVTLLDYLRDYVGRLRGGDMGPLPAIAGLVVLYIVFGLANDKFWSLLNQANLVVQAGAICVLAMGLVLVLLLGEIDLAAGYTGGTSAAVAMLAISDHGYSWWLAVIVEATIVAASYSPIINAPATRASFPEIVELPMNVPPALARFAPPP